MTKWNQKGAALLVTAVFMIFILLLGMQGYEADLLEKFPASEAEAGMTVGPDKGEAGKGEKEPFIVDSLPYLEKGKYYIEIEYSPLDADFELEVFLPDTIGSDNRPGVVAAGPERSVSGSLTGRVGLRLEESVYGLEIRAYTSGEALKIQKLVLKSDGILFTDDLFLAAVCAVLLAAIWRSKKAPSQTVLLLCGISLLAFLPCLRGGLIDGHDVQYHLARIEGVYQGMLRGEIPLRINSVQMNGYGYLSGMMYPQLFLYLPAFLRLLGVSLMSSYKILIFLTGLGTASLTFWSVRRVLHSRQAGLWAAFLYTLSPYRLLDIYTRGAVGEVLAMMFFPLVFAGVYEALWGDRGGWKILALGLTGVIQSHVLSVEMAGIFIGLAGLVWLAALRSGKKFLSGLASICKAGILFLGLNLFFLAPFLYYSRAQLWIFRIKYPLHDTGAYLRQIFAPLIHAGGESLGLGMTEGEMSYGIGLAYVAGILLFLAWRVFGGRKPSRAAGTGWFCLAAGLGGCLLASNLFPWEQVQSVGLLNTLFSAIQFAWRFLGISSFLLSVAAAAALAEAGDVLPRMKWAQGFVLLVVLVTMLYYYHSVAVTEPVLEDKMSVNGTDMTDYLYLYGPVEEDQFTRAGGYVSCVGDSEVEISGFYRKGTRISVDISVKSYAENSWLIFPLYSYWGYEATLDQDQRVEAGTAGNKVAIPLPPEGGHVDVEFVPHYSFRIADLVSAAVALILAGDFFFHKGKRGDCHTGGFGGRLRSVRREGHKRVLQ